MVLGLPCWPLVEGEENYTRRRIIEERRGRYKKYVERRGEGLGSFEIEKCEKDEEFF
jgi:hypothetical protein